MHVQNLGQYIWQFIGFRRDPQSDESRARVFTNLMLQGRLKAAIRVLAEHDSGRILRANEITPASDLQSVLDILWTKHPRGQPPLLDVVIGKIKHPPAVYPTTYNRIDGKTFK